MKFSTILLSFAAVAVASVAEPAAEPVAPVPEPTITSEAENPADIHKLKQMIHDKKCAKVAHKCPPPPPKCVTVTKTVNKTVTKTAQAKQQCHTPQQKCGKHGC
ncbi:hypothetical protein CJU90_5495 [Yarrowia sp. C11]|nr:hypothetical protein CJU90_5495 [Yarrowia sp. C11]KAG5364085.1 hypothetical protein CKK34_2874 [Yarrowia sp. E02]